MDVSRERKTGASTRTKRQSSSGNATNGRRKPTLAELTILPMPPRRRHFAKVFGALASTLVVVALLIVYVWSRTEVLHLGYELSSASQEREALLEENRRLRIELTVLTRADRLEPMAVKQLGLTSARHDQIMFVTKEKLPLPPSPGLASPDEIQNEQGPYAKGETTKLTRVDGVK